MKKGVESCGAQAAQAKEATSTGANVLEIPERRSAGADAGLGRNGRRRSDDYFFSGL